MNFEGQRPAPSASPAFAVPAGRPIITRLFKGGFAVNKTLQVPTGTTETDNGPIHSPERRLAAGFGRTTIPTVENACHRHDAGQLHGLDYVQSHALGESGCYPGHRAGKISNHCRSTNLTMDRSTKSRNALASSRQPSTNQTTGHPFNVTLWYLPTAE